MIEDQMTIILDFLFMFGLKMKFLDAEIILGYQISWQSLQAEQIQSLVTEQLINP